jgi:hypothetical protein
MGGGQRRRRLSRRQAGTALIFGLVTIAMNVAIYEAISRIPLGTAVAIEFLGLRRWLHWAHADDEISRPSVSPLRACFCWPEWSSTPT